MKLIKTQIIIFEIEKRFFFLSHDIPEFLWVLFCESREIKTSFHKFSRIFIKWNGFPFWFDFCPFSREFSSKEKEMFLIFFFSGDPKLKLKVKLIEITLNKLKLRRN